MPIITIGACWRHRLHLDSLEPCSGAWMYITSGIISDVRALPLAPHVHLIDMLHGEGDILNFKALSVLENWMAVMLSARMLEKITIPEEAMGPLQHAFSHAWGNFKEHTKNGESPWNMKYTRIQLQALARVQGLDIQPNTKRWSM